MEEDNRTKRIRFFSNFKMIADLEDSVNEFLARTDIEIVSVHPLPGLVAILYYKKA